MTIKQKKQFDYSNKEIDIVASESEVAGSVKKILILAMLISTCGSIFMGVIVGPVIEVMLFMISFYVLFYFLMIMLVLYFSKKYRTSIIIDKEQNVIQKIKKGQKAATYNLGTIKEFFSQRILDYPWGQYKLFLKLDNGQEIILLNEIAMHHFRRWEMLAEKVSIRAGRPLIRQIFIIDLMSREKREIPFEMKRGFWHTKLPILITLAIIPFLCALIFSFFTSTKIFILGGVITILLNTAIILYVSHKDYKDMNKSENEKNAFLIATTLISITASISLYLAFLYFLAVHIHLGRG